MEARSNWALRPSIGGTDPGNEIGAGLPMHSARNLFFCVRYPGRRQSQQSVCCEPLFVFLPIKHDPHMGDH